MGSISKSAVLDNDKFTGLCYDRHIKDTNICTETSQFNRSVAAPADVRRDRKPRRWKKEP